MTIERKFMGRPCTSLDGTGLIEVDLRIEELNDRTGVPKRVQASVMLPPTMHMIPEEQR